MSKVILVAPLAGWSTPLEEAPDAVFAGRMLGDGLAIDPTESTLYAPCAGELIAVPESRHAITLRTPAGAEILLHVGIDTVSLGGEGFKLHVRQGQRVSTGEPLLTFDMDLLARRAKSLLTPILVLEGGTYAVGRRNQDREVRVGDVLMELVPIVAAGLGAAAGSDGPAAVVSRRVSVELEHGIHARPAALLAAAVKGFTADVTLIAHGRQGSARSTISLMTLGVRKGDEVEIRASGTDAAAAVDAVEVALRTDHSVSETPARRRVSPVVPSETLPKEDNILRGVIASRGLAVGRIVQLTRPEISVPESGAGVGHEIAELDRARGAVKVQIQAAAGSGPEAAREIMGAHLELLDDPELLTAARGSIANGKSAGHAWRQAIRSTVDALRALGDVRMAERVDDLLDLESQVLTVLSGDGAVAARRELPEKALLVAKELLPSQLVALDASRLAGICMAAGGATSHVAILAAAMGIPVLVAMGATVLALSDGTTAVLDAERGLLRINPDRDQLNAAQGELQRLNGQVTGFGARLDQVDATLADRHQQALRAEATILAVGQLRSALATSKPFAKQLAAVRAMVPGDADMTAVLDQMQPFADTGVETTDDLTRDFGRLAPALVRSAIVGDGQSWWRQALYHIESVISVRRVGADVPGDSTEAVVARAEARLDEDDLQGAIGALQVLTGVAADLASPWIHDAGHRIAVDGAESDLSRLAISRVSSGTPTGAGAATPSNAADPK